MFEGAATPSDDTVEDSTDNAVGARAGRGTSLPGLPDPIYTGTAQLLSGGWAKPNPHCKDCTPDQYRAHEAEPDDAATYVTLRIPADITLGALDRYELTITAPEVTA